MAKVAFMADSGADILEEEIRELNIKWMPVEIIFPSGKRIYDTADIDVPNFYEQMKKEPNGKFVSVQIKTDDIIAAAEELLQTHDYVLYITMSSKMSGTYLNALTAQKHIGSRLIVFDSRSISTGQSTLTLKAFYDIRDGKVDPEHIMDYLQSLRNRLRFYFILESLEYLRKGGRIGKASYLIGNMLKLKPALAIDDTGEIYAVAKIRGGKKRIIKFYANLLEKEPPDIDFFPLQFVYSIPTEWDMAMQQWIEEHGIPYQQRLTRPTTTVHGGPYSLGLSWFVKT